MLPQIALLDKERRPGRRDKLRSGMTGSDFSAGGQALASHDQHSNVSPHRQRLRDRGNVLRTAHPGSCAGRVVLPARFSDGRALWQGLCSDVARTWQFCVVARWYEQAPRVQIHRKSPRALSDRCAEQRDASRSRCRRTGFTSTMLNNRLFVLCNMSSKQLGGSHP